jgi:hypothetical protein
LLSIVSNLKKFAFQVASNGIISLVLTNVVKSVKLIQDSKWGAHTENHANFKPTFFLKEEEEVDTKGHESMKGVAILPYFILVYS